LQKCYFCKKLLQVENNLTITRLKQLYHVLSKKTYPDLTKGTDAVFLKLHKEYEKALEILGRDKYRENTRLDHEPSKIQNPCKTVLQFLYVYAIKFYGSDAESVLLKLIRASEIYSPVVHNLLQSYYKVFFKTFHDWHRTASIYYTHNIFIASIKQLFYYYSLNIPLHKRLLFVYFDDLKRRSARLNSRQQKVLLDAAEWLKREVDKDKIKIF